MYNNNFNSNYYNPLNPNYNNTVMQPNYNNSFYNNNNNNSPQMPIQQSSTNTNMIYANGVEDVKGRMLNNNSKFVFFDNDKSVIYIRSVDNVGKSDIQIFDYVPHENTPTPTIDPEQYVLKADFLKLKEEFDKLKSLPVKVGE